MERKTRKRITTDVREGNTALYRKVKRAALSRRVYFINVDCISTVHITGKIHKIVELLQCLWGFLVAGKFLEICRDTSD